MRNKGTGGFRTNGRERGSVGLAPFGAVWEVLSKRRPVRVGEGPVRGPVVRHDPRRGPLRAGECRAGAGLGGVTRVALARAGRGGVMGSVRVAHHPTLTPPASKERHVRATRRHLPPLPLPVRPSRS